MVSIFEAIKLKSSEKAAKEESMKAMKHGKGLVKIPKRSYQKEDDVSKRVDKLKDFQIAYDKVPLINAIINNHANQVVQEFYFENEDEKEAEAEAKKAEHEAKREELNKQQPLGAIPKPEDKKIKESFDIKKEEPKEEENASESSSIEKLNQMADDVNLLQVFHVIEKNKKIFGDCFVEVVKSAGGDIKKIKVLNSIWMQVYRNPVGKVTGYSQIIENEKLILWGSTGKPQDDAKFKSRVRDFKSIVHFKNNVLGSEKYGRSLIEPLVDSINSKIQMEHDAGKILNRYVAPLIHATVGNDDMPAQSGAVTNVATTLRDLHAESEIVTSHLVKLEVLDFDKKGMDISGPIEHMDQNIITGGQVPPVLLGIKDSDSKAAEVQLRNFGRTVKASQRELKIEFEDSIIVGQEVGSNKDKLIWGKAEEREWEIDVDIIRGLVTDGVITPQKANSLLPPKFREELPDPAEKAAEMQAAMGTGEENAGPPGANGPRPTQKKDGKQVKDNPNDPTKTTKDKNAGGKRTDKGFRDNPKSKPKPKK